MNFGPVVREMSFKDISYLELWLPLCSVDWNHLCNIGRRRHEAQFGGIILNLDQWFRRNCHLNVFVIWSSGRPFVHLSVTICAILEEGIQRNNAVKLFEFKDVILKISYLELWQPSCLVERSHLCNFERKHHGEHSCEVICNLDQWFRRCCLMTFLI